MNDIKCMDLLDTLVQSMSGDQLARFKWWIGAEPTLPLTEELCILAQEWVGNCEAKGYRTYETLPDDDDIGKLTAEGWETIRDIEVLESLWEQVSQDKALKKQVCKMARPGKQDFTWPRSVQSKLDKLGVLQVDDDDHDLFPLFKAYVFYKHTPQGRTRIWRKRELGKIELTIDELRQDISAGWDKLVTAPQVLTALAFCFLAIAFIPLGVSFDKMIEACRNWSDFTLILFILFITVAIGVCWRRKKSSILLAVILFVLIYALFATWVIFPRLSPPGIIPAELHSPTCILIVSSSALFLILLSIVKIESIREHYVILLIVSLISAALVEWLIGLPPGFIARVTTVVFTSFIALWLLHWAGSEQVQEAQTLPLRKFLEQVTDGDSWSHPLKKWRWPNGLLFSILFLLALLLFFSLFTLEQNPPCSTDNAKIQLVYPSWLSDRDRATLYVTTTLTESVTSTQQTYLEPIKSGQIFLKEVEITTPNLPTPTPTSIGTPAQLITITNTSSQPIAHATHAQWEIHTLPPEKHWSLADWQFRASLVDKNSGKVEHLPNCTISIARLKLPFGLRGFLEVQPFVTLVGILYGLAQTTVQLWVGEKAFGDGNGHKEGKKPKKQAPGD